MSVANNRSRLSKREQMDQLEMYTLVHPILCEIDVELDESHKPVQQTPLMSPSLSNQRGLKSPTWLPEVGIENGSLNTESLSIPWENITEDALVSGGGTPPSMPRSTSCMYIDSNYTKSKCTPKELRLPPVVHPLKEKYIKIALKRREECMEYLQYKETTYRNYLNRLSLLLELIGQASTYVYISQDERIKGLRSTKQRYTVVQNSCDDVLKEVQRYFTHVTTNLRKNEMQGLHYANPDVSEKHQQMSRLYTACVSHFNGSNVRTGFSELISIYPQYQRVSASANMAHVNVQRIEKIFKNGRECLHLDKLYIDVLRKDAVDVRDHIVTHQQQQEQLMGGLEELVLEGFRQAVSEQQSQDANTNKHDNPLSILKDKGSYLRKQQATLSKDAEIWSSDKIEKQCNDIELDVRAYTAASTDDNVHNGQTEYEKVAQRVQTMSDRVLLGQQMILQSRASQVSLRDAVSLLDVPKTTKYDYIRNQCISPTAVNKSTLLAERDATVSLAKTVHHLGMGCLRHTISSPVPQPISPTLLQPQMVPAPIKSTYLNDAPPSFHGVSNGASICCSASHNLCRRAIAQRSWLDTHNIDLVGTNTNECSCTPIPNQAALLGLRPQNVHKYVHEGLWGGKQKEQLFRSSDPSVAPQYHPQSMMLDSDKTRDKLSQHGEQMHNQVDVEETNLDVINVHSIATTLKVLQKNSAKNIDLNMLGGLEEEEPAEKVEVGNNLLSVKKTTVRRRVVNIHLGLKPKTVQQEYASVEDIYKDDWEILHAALFELEELGLITQDVMIMIMNHSSPVVATVCRELIALKKKSGDLKALLQAKRGNSNNNNTVMTYEAPQFSVFPYIKEDKNVSDATYNQIYTRMKVFLQHTLPNVCLDDPKPLLDALITPVCSQGCIASLTQLHKEVIAENEQVWLELEKFLSLREFVSSAYDTVKEFWMPIEHEEDQSIKLGT